MQTKLCKRCSNQKEVSEFYRNARSYSSWCRDCYKERSRQQVLSGQNRASKERAARAKGIQGRRRLSDLERAVYESWNNAKKHAFRQGLDFGLTIEQVHALFDDFCSKHHHVFGAKHPFRPSLDRIDNAQGYIPSNVRVLWLIENYARNTFTDEEVLEFCKRKLGLL